MAPRVEFKVIDGLSVDKVLQDAAHQLSYGWRFFGPMITAHYSGQSPRFSQVLAKVPQRYLILKDPSPDALQREVSLAMESGFVPHGPLVTEKLNGQPLFIQAMCLAPLSL